MSLAVFYIPVPARFVLCYSGDFSAATVALVVQRNKNVGMALGVLRGLGYCPPSGVY